MADYPTATRDQVRAFDRYAVEHLAVPGIVLMENAGRQVADVAKAMVKGIPDPQVLILAGRGNNGGDALVAARHFRTGGLRPDVVLLATPDQVQGDALTNLRIIQNMGLAVLSLVGAAEEVASQLRPLLERAHLVIDGLLGTGTTGQVREPYASVITAVNAAGRPVLSIDIPSGLDCDTGRPLGPTIRATKTVTMAAIKTGFAAPGAAEYTGEVILADIGVPFEPRVA